MSNDTGAVQLPGAIGPYLDIYFTEIHHWQAYQVAAFAIAILFGTRVLSVLAWVLAKITSSPQLRTNPKFHYDELCWLDCSFILCNRISTVCFSYHAFRVLTLTPSISWKAEDATFINVVLALVPMFIIYDFFYSAWHCFLHWRPVYPYIHKHHHKQASPTRGHNDAFNVHPLEFVVGEYIHMVAFYLVPCHIFAVVIFMTLAGILPTMNHLRFHVCIPGLFDSSDHAMHHRLYTFNYGQYTMFWDKLWGSYRRFDEALDKVG